MNNSINVLCCDDPDFVSIEECENGTVKVTIEELYRGKFFRSDIGMALYMNSKKELLKRLYGENINVVDFEDDNEDDYNSFNYELTIKADNKEEAKKIVKVKELIIKKVLSDIEVQIKPFVENLIDNVKLG